MTHTPDNAPAPLIIEAHSDTYTGAPFLTLIEHRHGTALAIVDNLDGDDLHVYLLDMCDPEGVDVQTLMTVATEWYAGAKMYPLSIEFSKRNLTAEVCAIYRTLNVGSITRIVGPVATYPYRSHTTIKHRRRRVSVSKSMYHAPD